MLVEHRRHNNWIHLSCGAPDTSIEIVDNSNLIQPRHASHTQKAIFSSHLTCQQPEVSVSCSTCKPTRVHSVQHGSIFVCISCVLENPMLRLLFLCWGWLGWTELGLGLQVQRLYLVAGGAGSDRTG